MAIDERARHQLYQKLEEVLGSQEATVLMEHLPPVGWADVATKRDLEHLAEINRLEHENLAESNRLDHENLRNEFRAELAEVKTEIRGDLLALSNRMTALVLTGMIGVGGLAFAAARLV
jgi:hypothetical protein